MAPTLSSVGEGDGLGGGAGVPPPVIRFQALQALGDNNGDSGTTHAFLEDLYCLVKKLSSVLSLYEEYAGDSFFMDLSSCGPVIYGLIFHLSNWAFEELRSQFELIFGIGKPVIVAKAASAQFHLHQTVSSSHLQDFCILLRCCIIMLHLLEFELNLVMEKGQILVKMLEDLCSPDVMLLFLPQNGEADRWITGIQSSVSQGNMFKGASGFEHSSKETSPPIPLVHSILEVFLDELLVHKNLKKHIAMTYHITSTSVRLLTPDYVTCDIGIILELVSTHFLLSSFDEMAFRRLLHSKPCCKMMDTVNSKVSLAAALALLRTPAIFSASYILQSHVILLVSRCITFSRELTVTAMECFMSAFEQSVILYTCHSTSLPLFYDCTGAKCQSRSSVTDYCILEGDLCVAFDFYVRKVTSDAVNLHSQKLGEQFSEQACGFLSKSKAEALSTCMAYFKENRHILLEPWREDASFTIKCIIERIAGEIDEGPLRTTEVVNWPEIYLVAALLKLMGSSLLQIVAVLSEQGKRTLKDCIICSDYELLSSIVKLLGNHSVDQYIICDIQAEPSSKHKQTKLMLAHSASLLFYSIHRRLYPLWEDCIFVMIAVMNLLSFEEGNLDAVKAMCGCVREISISQLSASEISLGLAPRESSVKIASNFQQIQTLHSNTRVKCPTNESSRNDIRARETGGRDEPSRISPCTSPRGKELELSSEELGKCNGEAFLRCFVEDNSIPDWDDLANFIEARPGKDYAGWLKKRATFNQWKHKKADVARHQGRKRKLRKMTK